MGKIPTKHNPYASGLVVHSAVITAGAESNDTRAITVQLKDQNGKNLEQRVAVLAYLSSDAGGGTPHATPADTLTATTGALMVMVTGLAMLLITDATGKVVFNLTQDATATYYLHLLAPDGSLISSNAIAFA